MRSPPDILFHAIPAPSVVWRADTGFFHPSGRTAADVIRYEQSQLGHALDVSPAHVRELEDYSADALFWATLTREDALRYGSAAEFQLDIPAFVIANDDQGGLLLFFPDDLTESAGAAAMADQPEIEPAFAMEDAQRAALEDEEEKRRAGRGVGGMSSPADANLGANIRPDIGSGPAGLETYTTQKSADYRADPEQNISNYFRERLAERRESPAREGNASFASLEAIAADPQNDSLDEVARLAVAHADYVSYTRDFAAKGDAGAAEWLERKGYDPAPAVDAEQFYFLDPDTGKPRIAGNPALSPREAVEAYAEHCNYTVGEKGDQVDPDFWRAGTDRILMIAEDGDYITSGNTYRELATQLVEEGNLTPVDALVRQADESARRQDAERAARSGESVSSEVEASVSDYFKTRLSEAKAEREAEGAEAELAVIDHGEGNTPGGGGRGMF